jgi:hypothetical protein
MSTLDSFPSKDRQDKPLSEKAAHQVADMMRAKLEASPETGRIPTDDRERMLMQVHSQNPELGREPTKKDYDDALAAIETLKKLAPEETSFKKIRDMFGRLSANSASAGLVFMDALMRNYDNIKDDVLKGTFDESSEKTGDFIDPKMDKVKDWRARFENATYQLRKLKKEAEKYD